MNRILASSIAAVIAAITGHAFADDYQVFKVCQDTRVLHTSDGADAGHVEYVVVNPGDQRIVSTVVGGGVLGERLVAVPFEDVGFEGGAVVLREITRERLVAAPVFERNRIVEGGRLDVSIYQNSANYFGGRNGVSAREGQPAGGVPNARPDAGVNRDPRAEQPREASQAPNEVNRDRNVQNQPPERNGTATNENARENGRDAAHENGRDPQDQNRKPGRSNRTPTIGVDTEQPGGNREGAPGTKAEGARKNGNAADENRSPEAATKAGANHENPRETNGASRQESQATAKESSRSGREGSESAREGKRSTGETGRNSEKAGSQGQ